MKLLIRYQDISSNKWTKHQYLNKRSLPNKFGFRSIPLSTLVRFAPCSGSYEYDNADLLIAALGDVLAYLVAAIPRFSSTLTATRTG